MSPVVTSFRTPRSESGWRCPASSWASSVPPPCSAGEGGLGALGIAGTVSGTRGPEGRRLSEKLHKDKRRLPWSVPTAQQRCSARGSLGLGMSCFGPQREFLSPSRGEAGSQDAQHDTCEKWDVLVVVSRAHGTALAAIPPCLLTESGSASAPRSLCWHVDWAVSSSSWDAAGSQEQWALPWAAGGSCSLGNHAGTPQPIPAWSSLLLAGSLGTSCRPGAGEGGRRGGRGAGDHPALRSWGTVWSRGHCAL